MDKCWGIVVLSFMITFTIMSQDSAKMWWINLSWTMEMCWLMASSLVLMWTFLQIGRCVRTILGNLCIVDDFDQVKESYLKVRDEFETLSSHTKWFRYFVFLDILLFLLPSILGILKSNPDLGNFGEFIWFSLVFGIAIIFIAHANQRYQTFCDMVLNNTIHKSKVTLVISSYTYFTDCPLQMDFFGIRISYSLLKAYVVTAGVAFITGAFNRIQYVLNLGIF